MSNSRVTPTQINPQSNVIILTSGLTGSSVLTGLLVQGGYWPGAETMKKEYDTYENVALIKLNERLIHEAGYRGRYEMEFRADLLDRIGSLGSAISDAPYREFLADCNRHQPWVWKDPRLWATIRYWTRLLGWERCRPIVLTRSLVHCWISTTLRRQIRSYASLKRYEKSIEHSILAFLNDSHLGYLHITYDELITRPERTIDKLNAYLSSCLTVNDLKAIYRGELYKRPRKSALDAVKAGLIYLKNISERWDLKEIRTVHRNQ